MVATVDVLLTRAKYPDRLIDKLCLYHHGLIASTAEITPLRHLYFFAVISQPRLERMKRLIWAWGL